MKVFIVEDEKLLIQAIQRKLAKAGIESDYSELGFEAIEKLLKMKVLPDVIWLDYYLPDINGIEFIKLVKENDKLKNLNIVVVSNSANDENVDVIMALGAKKYIIKAEHTMEDIIDTIKNLN